MKIVSSSDTPAEVEAAIRDDGGVQLAPAPDTRVVDTSYATYVPPPVLPDETPSPTPEAGANETPTDAGVPAQAQPAGTSAEPVSPVGDAAASKAKRPKHDLQRRINELTWQKSQEKRRADALQAELDAVKSRYAASAGQTTGATPQEPREEDFSDYSAYIEALVSYRTAQGIEQALNARDIQARQRAAREQLEREALDLDAAHVERVIEAKSKYPDFDTVTNQDIDISLVMRDAIIRSPNSADLVYYFGKHPEEAVRISALPDGMALMEIGRLTGMLGATAQAPQAAPVTAPVARPPARSMTTAPSPITPVAGGAHAATVDEDSLPLSEFILRMNARDREQGRAL